MKKTSSRIARAIVVACFAGSAALVAAPSAVAADSPSCVEVSASHSSYSVNGGATDNDFYYAIIHNDCSSTVSVRAEHGPFTWAWCETPCYTIAPGDTVIGTGYPWGPNNIVSC